MNPAGTKRSREIAEVMGLTVKQLKTVAEVYNPGCFQKITGRFQLSPGRAFDLSLGDDLLNEDKQYEVTQYVKVTKPGLVCIAPPCKMYTQLQNLSKEKRARLPDLMKRYLKNKAEGDRLLIFAIRLCELCDDLGIKFIYLNIHTPLPPGNTVPWSGCWIDRMSSTPRLTNASMDYRVSQDFLKEKEPVSPRTQKPSLKLWASSALATMNTKSSLVATGLNDHRYTRRNFDRPS